MQILSVTLKNFKIHRDRHFEFQPGINAICGENGSGKTSILEAIAWALFDYDSGYKKDELRHQNAKSAEVSISMISNLDGRTYTVQRETAKGRSDRYIIFDPQLNTQVSEIHKLDDAQRWLREHLGMPKGTNLSQIFADVIGIPQGTFTLDFLKSATERRKVFDPILKVEEYKQAFKSSSDLERYAQSQAEDLVRSIGHLGDRLQDWEELKKLHLKQARAVEHTQAFLETLKAQLQTLATERTTLQAEAQAIEALQRQIEQTQSHLREHEASRSNQTQLVAQAQQAQVICTEHHGAYERYHQGEEVLKQLNQEQRSRAQLQKKKSLHEAQLAPIQVQHAQIQTQLDQLDAGQKALIDLRPQAQQQIQWETEREQLQTQINQLQSETLRQSQFQTQRQTLQAQGQALAPELERLRSLSSAIDQVPQFEERIHQLQTQLGQVSAAQQFQSCLLQLVEQTQSHTQSHQEQVKKALKNIKKIQAIALRTPAFQNTIQNALEQTQQSLESGLQLHQSDLDQLQIILTNLQAQSDEDQLRSDLKATQIELKALQRQRLEYETLPSKTQQYEQNQAQIATLDRELNALEKTLAIGADLPEKLEEVARSLAALGDPRGRGKLLEEQQRGAENLQRRQQDLARTQQDLALAIATLSEQLEIYGDLDAQLEAQTAAQQENQTGYRLYLQNQTTAQQLAAQQNRLEALMAEQQILQTKIEQLQADFTTATAAHDPQKRAELEQDYGDTKAHFDQMNGALPGQRQELARIEQELTQRSHWAEERDRLQQSLGNKQRVQQFVGDARRIYNQSGPRITQFYLNEIVREGDRLFRELMNRQNAALNWTEDYEIQIQEGSVWRNFKTLSGGEQMAAALAVRLALLKILADLDIAFFDEPTTNMDKPRREQLAEALSQLKTFRQLFVISHDDTFETLTDNVIRVERQTLA